ncbi:hypothetical protein LQV05_002093 [Cryptococcus neoformans]|nr:NADH dehydrogenase (ubiquinone) Fe-S protein 4 [Cryptococcus neoformans var. grubii]OXC58175.1 NADH dehydrogenase (ubiquinone) Fe-S protein 4 [Cryptococcus neoformans var. grubii MW-RSA852]UOH85274.1 hypothetical protein LQV05_002093 [Cryptococcus neoformans]
MFSLRPLLRSSQLATAARRTLHYSAPAFNASTRPESPVTPVPTVQDGTVPTEYELANGPQADLVSGAPAELLHRPVRIFRPAKNSMQSAKGKTKRWMIDFDVLQGAGRWENRLIGWASSADYVQGTTLAFRSKEDAIYFAEKQGWPYKVDEPKKIEIPPKSYANNYVHVPGKLRIHHTK